MHWISLGHGYEITGMDVLNAYSAVMQAAPGAGVGEHRIKEQIREMISGSQPGHEFVKTLLANQLSS